MNFDNFSYHYKSFADFASGVDLSHLVLRCYGAGDTDLGDAWWKICLGSFPLGDDLVLILADAEDCQTWADLDASIKKFGVEMIRLSTLLGEQGLSIFPSDQLTGMTD